MFSKAFLTLVALAALSIAAPIANFEGSAGDYQYLSRRGNPSRPAPHRSASLPPPAQHDQHGSTSHSGRPAPHRSASLPLPAPHNQHGSTSHSHGNSPPHSPHPAHAGGSHHGTPAHSPHNTPHHTPPHSPTHAHASGSQHGSHPHQHLISEVQAAGHKISAADVVHIWRLPRPIPNVNGQHAWLEKGSATAGMQHIMHKHGAEFAAKGITEHQIPHLAEKATTSGEIVGTQGSSRTIYKTQHNGQTEHVAVETGKNGFVVGMNPSSEKSAQKAAKAWKKKLAKDAANPPDQHPGKGPGPGPGPTGGAGAGAITTRR